MYKLKNFSLHDFNDSQEAMMFTYVCQMAKYDNAIELPTKVLIEQLHLRSTIIKLLDENNPSIVLHSEVWNEMIFSDSIIIHQLDCDDIVIDIGSMLADGQGLNEWLSWCKNESNETTSSLDLAKKLSSRNSVRPLHVKEIHQMSAISHQKNFQDLDSFSSHYIYNPMTELFTDKYKEAHGRQIALSLNLSDYTDEEILDDIRHLLGRWRKETRTISKPSPLKVSCINLKKLINNKYLLLLDAMIMSRVFNRALTDELLVKYIYPHLNIQPDSFRKTYKRNALAFSSPQFFAAWENTLTDLGLWEQPVQQALQKKF